MRRSRGILLVTIQQGTLAETWRHARYPSADIRTVIFANTSDVVGGEVAQLYVSLGGSDDPPAIRYGFKRIRIDLSASGTILDDITLRDLSNWDTGC